MNRVCEVLRPGLVPYAEAWAMQQRIAEDLAGRRRPEALILLEHSPVYTVGRSGRAENILWSEAERAARGVEVHWVDRGGDATYHGPGQLVGYPILRLRPAAVGPDGRLPQADYVGYIRRLEEVLIHALASFGVVSGQVPGRTGVWVQPDVASRCPHCPPAARQVPSKIAAIGVKVDARGVTRHGFALNVNPDMSFFEGLVACGLKDAPAVSLAHFLYEPPSLDAVMDEVVRQFGMVFGYEMVEAESWMGRSQSGNGAEWISG